MQNKRVIVGLGSNQNAIENLRKVLLELRRETNLKILKVSRIYESDAQLPQNAPENWNQPYLNAAVLVEVSKFDALPLLKQLKGIETRLGRIVSERWAPRVIDLDILYVENFKFHSQELHIPHPMLSERPFAFLPASEVLPSLLLSKQDRSQTFNTQVSSHYYWPEFVAIMNVTPDSFSDGGKHNYKDGFMKQARQLIQDGADYLDIGAESTRPQAETVMIEEETRRLMFAMDCIEELKSEGLKFKISIDSRNHESISNVLKKYQIQLVNDVSGLGNYKMLDLIKEHNLKAVCMHSLSVPANRSIELKPDSDPVVEISNWWALREKVFSDYHIIAENIYFDPGFGFGKNIEQNMYLIDHLDYFSHIKNKFFLGYSRKSFLVPSTYNMQNSNLHQPPPSRDRDIETAKITQKLNLAFCQFIRVHDVKTQTHVLNQSSANLTIPPQAKNYEL